MPARVVFVRSKSPAGIEPRLAKEAGSLARAGYEVHAILWDRTRSFPAHELRDGIRIHRYHLAAPEGTPGLARRLPRWQWFVLRTAARLRPDVIHAVDLDTAWASRAAGRITGAKLVYDVFDFYADMITADVPPRIRERLAAAERRTIERADLVIVPDLRRQAQFRGARPRQIVEIMNVPEDRPLDVKAAPDFTVFYGGMIAKDRGLLDLLAACESTGAKLLVAGHGPDESMLLPHLETSPACMFLGTIPYDEVLRQTAASHAVAALYDPNVPNNRYAAPNKAFEAMMYAKPVITSDGTAIGDLVRSLGSGVVVPYGDRPALRRALEELMLSPEQCDRLGARGRAAFESGYQWKAMEARLLAAYGSLLGPRAPMASRRSSIG
jgi:glycosyltransferase involved in cell wall biosynthesis